MIDYLTVKEVGQKWNISGRMVTLYCKAGKIEGAIKKGNLWLIPANAEKPMDGRTINARKAKDKMNMSEHQICKDNFFLC